MTEGLDKEVGTRLYAEFVRTACAPPAAQLAELLEMSVEQIRESLERLAGEKAIVLQPESREILMANPLCAVPTPFAVRAGDQFFFGSCVWDAMGIMAMLQRDARLETSCACCGEAIVLDVREGCPTRENGVVHFALPAKRWWENIVFT